MPETIPTLHAAAAIAILELVEMIRGVMPLLIGAGLILLAGWIGNKKSRG